MLSNYHHCKACGSSLRESGRFCSKCGTAVGDNLIAVNVLTQTQSLTGYSAWVDFKQILKFYGTFLAISFTYFIVSKFTKHPSMEVLIWFSVGVMTLFYSYPIRNDILELLKPKLPKIGDLLLICLMAVFCYFLLTGYFSLFDHFKTETTKYTNNILKYSWPTWTAYFLTAVCPGILEEIGFRGLIYKKLKELFPVNEALFIQAACFSVLHLMPTIFISHLIMGLFLGWVREKTNSLILSMAFHMAWNALVVFNELNKTS